MPMNSNKRKKWVKKLKSKPWTEWSKAEKKFFRKLQEAEPIDQTFARRYAKLCNALEAIWLEAVEPTSESGEVDFDNLPPLVSDWSRKTASGILRILARS